MIERPRAQESVVSAYHRATFSTRETLYRQVLLACALAPGDDLGYFASGDVRRPLSAIMGRPYDIPAFSQHLNELSEGSRGPVLQKAGTSRKFRFRFINPLLPALRCAQRSRRPHDQPAAGTGSDGRVRPTLSNNASHSATPPQRRRPARPDKTSARPSQREVRRVGSAVDAALSDDGARLMPGTTLAVLPAPRISG